MTNSNHFVHYYVQLNVHMLIAFNISVLDSGYTVDSLMFTIWVWLMFVVFACVTSSIFVCNHYICNFYFHDSKELRETHIIKGSRELRNLQYFAALIDPQYLIHSL